MNGKTFRGDYSDPNQMFKAICSFIGKNKPDVCRQVNFKNGRSQDERDNFEQTFDYDNAEDKAEAEK